MTLKCRLCSNFENVEHFLKVEKPFKANYFHCSQCDLIMLDENQLFKSSEEIDHYKLHKNDKKDPGYVSFLYRCLTPTLKFLSAKMKGLDFGCGPYPMLVELMKDEGYEMDYYDPYFYPEKDKLEQCYDFVIATEVVEHFNEPKLSWQELITKVSKGGILSIMTSMHNEAVDFRNWSYRYDHTHVSFYSMKTMHWIALNYQLEILEVSKNIVIFKKL